jgi:hypothetical protein
MKHRIIALLLGAAVLAAPMLAQSAQLPAPSPLEKELAARASDVTEVTLGKNMLGFASKFMDGKDKDQTSAKQVIDGLDGIYVREYEFDKDGSYSPEEAEQLRKYFETGEWTPMVHERERKGGETTDVMVKLVNGESRGMLVFEAEPRELTIVMILGPIRLEDLVKLKGLAGLGELGELGDAGKSSDSKEKKDKKGGQQ